MCAYNKRLVRLFFFVELLLTYCSVKAQPGTLDTTFNRLDTAAYLFNYVNAILYQPNGRIVIGGGPQLGYGMIDRFLPNGSYDSSFKTGAGFDQPVQCLVLQSDGKIIAGGRFSQFNGAFCSPLIRLLSNGNIDTSFQVPRGLLRDVSAVFLLPDGDIMVGDFPRAYRLHSDGSQDSSFIFNRWRDYNFGSVFAQQQDEKLLAYSEYEHELLRLDRNGNKDDSFRTGNGFLRNGFSGSVKAINPLPDGRILVAGSFDHYDGHIVGHLLRLYSNGKLDSSFHYTPPEIPSTMLLQPDGKILLGGFDYGVSRLNSDGSLDTSYNTGIVPPLPSGYFTSDDPPRALCLQADTQLLVGGYFYTTDKYVRIQLLRLRKDGALDAGFRIGSGVSGSVNAVVVQKDKKIVVAGTIDSYYGIPRYNVLRLFEDGSLDTGFVPRINYRVNDMVLQDDGKIILVGEFTECNGQSCTNLIRLNGDGSNDTSFHQGTGFAISDPTKGSPFLLDVFLQHDGKIIVNGGFEFYDGAAHTDIIRLNKDGTVDTSFRLTTSWLASIAQQVDEKLLITSPYWQLNGQSGIDIIRLDTNGKLDQTFKYQADNDWRANQIFLQENGNILVNMINIRDWSVASVRLLSNGSRDSAFQPQFPVDSNGRQDGGILNVQPDGKIFFGNGTSIGRFTREGVPDLAFIQNNSYNLYVNCITFQPDGKIIYAGTQIGQTTYSPSQIPDMSVKNGLYRMQNCMVVVAQHTPDSGRIGSFYESNIYWSKPDSFLRLSLLRGNVPPGLSLDAQTGTIRGIPEATGKFDFSISATNGECSDSLSYSIFIDSDHNVDSNTVCIIYPIPTRDFIKIRFGNSPAGNYDIRLSDLCGRSLSQGTVTVNGNHSEWAYDMRHFASGIYTLTIRTAKDVKVYKIELL